jgi:hemerythrin
VIIVTWNSSLETGHKVVDEQHKEIFALVEKMLDACTKGTFTSEKRKDEIEKALIFLKNYTVNHFSNEENLMEESNYTERNAHKAQHVSFLPILAGLREKALAEDNSLTAAMDINTALVNWLIQHIMGSDKRFADYYKSYQKK